MLHIEPVQKKRGFPGWAVPLAILVLVLALLIPGFYSVAGRTDGRQTQVLEDALHRASIQCYAIEGRYPPSVQYLEDHYGIVVDHERYAVFYDGFASNLMPDITVIDLKENDTL